MPFPSSRPFRWSNADRSDPVPPRSVPLRGREHLLEPENFMGSVSASNCLQPFQHRACGLRTACCDVRSRDRGVPGRDCQLMQIPPPHRCALPWFADAHPPPRCLILCTWLPSWWRTENARCTPEQDRQCRAGGSRVPARVGLRRRTTNATSQRDDVACFCFIDPRGRNIRLYQGRLVLPWGSHRCATQRVDPAFRCCATKVGRRRLLRLETTRNRAR